MEGVTGDSGNRCDVRQVRCAGRGCGAHWGGGGTGKGRGGGDTNVPSVREDTRHGHQGLDGQCLGGEDTITVPHILLTPQHHTPC